MNEVDHKRRSLVAAAGKAALPLAQISASQAETASQVIPNVTHDVVSDWGGGGGSYGPSRLHVSG